MAGRQFLNMIRVIPGVYKTSSLTCGLLDQK